MNTFDIFKTICDTLSKTNCPQENIKDAAHLINVLFETDNNLSVSTLVALNNNLPAYEGDGYTPAKNTEEHYKYLFYIYKSLNYDADKLIKELSKLCC